mmetsp:Transcript_49942/g.133693  ORF Transcript_49942/g.133693 Transcript_49942/m.133693 type:complete len:379 (+) Transcript_49942:1049-2185(+)
MRVLDREDDVPHVPQVVEVEGGCADDVLAHERHGEGVGLQDRDAGKAGHHHGGPLHSIANGCGSELVNGDGVVKLHESLHPDRAPLPEGPTRREALVLAVPQSPRRDVSKVELAKGGSEANQRARNLAGGRCHVLQVDPARREGNEGAADKDKVVHPPLLPEHRLPQHAVPREHKLEGGDLEQDVNPHRYQREPIRAEEHRVPDLPSEQPPALQDEDPARDVVGDAVDAKELMDVEGVLLGEERQHLGWHVGRCSALDPVEQARTTSAVVAPCDVLVFDQYAHHPGLDEVGRKGGVAHLLELLARIVASVLEEQVRASGVGAREVGDVADHAIDRNPQVPWHRVLLQLALGDLLPHGLLHVQVRLLLMLLAQEALGLH